MAIVETESIILRSYDLADADRIVVLLTHDHGVVRAVAKGAKRLKSRFGGGLEPFSTVIASYFKKENQELASLDKCEIIRSSFDRAGRPDFITQFSYLADILLALLPPEDPNETLYRMVRSCLDAASDPTVSTKALTVYFEVWLLRLSGFLPEWAACNVCQREFDTVEDAQLTTDLHLKCGNCSRTSGGPSVSATERNLAAISRRVSPTDFADHAASDNEAAERLSGVLRRMIASAAGRENIDRALVAGGRSK